MVCYLSFCFKRVTQMLSPFFSISGVGNINSAAFITSTGVLRNVLPNASSVYGGAMLTIIGNGFARNASDIQVMIGPNPCPVTRATADTVQCVVPAQGNSSDRAPVVIRSNDYTFPATFSLSYEVSLTPNINFVNWTADSGSIAFSITGSNFVIGNTSVTVGESLCAINSMSSILITCSISAHQPAGHHSIVVNVNPIGKSNSNNTYTHDLLVTSVLPNEGSYGGGLPVTVTGDGFNGSNITVNICNRSCTSGRGNFPPA